MGRLIRLRTAKDWGTCFCIERNGSLRFIIAAHVLVNCGCEPDASYFKACLCDERTQSSVDTGYDLTEIFWDHACDYAEFNCSFPGQAYQANPAIAFDGVLANIEGYLRGDEGMPPCNAPQSVEAIITGIKECSPGRNSISLVIVDMTTAPGLSGAPGTSASGEVMFVFARGTGVDQRFGGIEVSP